MMLSIVSETYVKPWLIDDMMWFGIIKCLKRKWLVRKSEVKEINCNRHWFRSALKPTLCSWSSSICELKLRPLYPMLFLFRSLFALVQQQLLFSLVFLVIAINHILTAAAKNRLVPMHNLYASRIALFSFAKRRLLRWFFFVLASSVSTSLFLGAVRMVN